MDVTGAPALSRPSPRESEQAEFFADVYPSLVAALSLMLRDRSEAEDVAQDTLVQLVARWDRLVPAVADLRAYGFRTAFNLVHSRRRRAAREASRWLRVGANPGAAAEPRTDAEVLNVLVGLARRQREVIVLRYFLQFSFREIAEVLGCREATARVHCHRGLDTLREHGYTAEEGD